jgi:hypothetical protein
MKLGTWLVIGGVATVSLATAGLLLWRARDRRKATAGAMFVGAVDEVELGSGVATARADGSGEFYDPEEIPSEHYETNELRGRMPFG